MIELENFTYIDDNKYLISNNFNFDYDYTSVFIFEIFIKMLKIILDDMPNDLNDDQKKLFNQMINITFDTTNDPDNSIKIKNFPKCIEIIKKILIKRKKILSNGNNSNITYDAMSTIFNNSKEAEEKEKKAQKARANHEKYIANSALLF